MNRFVSLPIALLVTSCALLNRSVPAPETAAHGLTAEEEGQLLRLEDRREFDPAVAHLWLTSGNPLSRARMAAVVS